MATIDANGTNDPEQAKPPVEATPTAGIPEPPSDGAEAPSLSTEAPVSTTSDADGAERHARDALLARNYADALRLLDGAIALDPVNGRLYGLRAQAYRGFEMSAEADADTARAQVLLGGSSTGQAPPEGPRPPTWPVELTVPYPPRLSRLLLLFKGLFVLPEQVLLLFHGAVAGVVSFLGVLVALFTGKYPKGFWQVYVGYFEHRFRVEAYYPLLMTDRYGGKDVSLHVDYPERLSRWLLVARLVLSPLTAILIIGSELMAGIIAIPAWFAILFTGRYPRVLFDYTLALFRWEGSLTIWSSNLRDERKLFRAAPHVWIPSTVLMLVYAAYLGVIFALLFFTGFQAKIEAQTPLTLYLQDGSRGDIAGASQLFERPAVAEPSVAVSFRDTHLYDHPLGVSVDTWNYSKSSGLPELLNASGRVLYESLPYGTFTAQLVSVNGQWRIRSVDIRRPSS